MIKVNKKGIKVKGSIGDILSDVFNIVKALKESGISEELILSAVKLGFTEDDKKEEYAKEVMKKKLEKILNKFKEEK